MQLNNNLKISDMKIIAENGEILSVTKKQCELYIFGGLEKEEVRSEILNAMFDFMNCDIDMLNWSKKEQVEKMYNLLKDPKNKWLISER